MKRKHILAAWLAVCIMLSTISPAIAVEDNTPAETGTETSVSTQTEAPVETVEPAAPDNGEETPAPDSGEETPAPDDGEETPAPDSGEETPAPGDGEGTPAPDSGEGTPAPGDGEEPPAPVEDEEQPEEPPVEEIPVEIPDVDTLYDGMTLEELYVYVNALVAEDEVRAMAYLKQMQADAQEVYAQLLAYAESQIGQEVPETVDFTDAGPFLDPVDLSGMPSMVGFLPARLARDLMRVTLQNAEGLQLDKRAEPNGDGTYKITLEAWATGEVITETVERPVDVILVLDQSGSMAWNFNGNSTNYANSRQKAMKDSVVNFINQVETKAANMLMGTEHRIALVTFGAGSATLSGFKSNYGALRSSVNGLPETPTGSTNTQAGMERANTILHNDTPPAGSRHKVVVLFTDGVPTTRSTFDPSVADGAVSAAKAIKDKGAAVYTVGIFNGANASQTTADIAPNWFYSNWRFSEIAAANRFMNYTSSNFRYATETGLESSGSVWKEKSGFTPPTRTASSYYLTASNATALDAIFQSIAQNIDHPDVALGADAAVTDFMSQYFSVKQSSVQVATQAYLGDNQWDSANPAALTVNKTNDKVSVTGFDFAKNFVSETEKTDGTKGKKLIITLDVTPKPGFFGGNQVPTNENTSGIYTPGDQNPVGTFPEPDVDVPLAYDIASRSQAIYLGNTADLGALMRYAEGYTPDGWNNAYVDIHYTLKQGDTVVGTYAVDAKSSAGSWTWNQTGQPALTEDTSYMLSCTVTPTETGTYGAHSPLAETPKVYVYKPQLTFSASDIWADYGKDVPLGAWALGDGTAANKPILNDVWTASAGAPPAEDTKPTIDNFSDLTYAFTKVNDGDAVLTDGTAKTGKKDTDFTAALNGFKINGHTFAATDATVTTLYPQDQTYFTLHTNKFNLTVTKTDNATAAYGPQSFLFNLTGDDGTALSFSLARGMDASPMSKTITGLLCGQSYTVSEKATWSWRYNTPASQTVAGDSTAHAQPSKSNPHDGNTNHNQSFTFANTFGRDKWLSGSDGKANIFNSTTA